MGQANPFIRIRCAVLLIREDGAVLLAKHHHNPFWVLPGGTLEPGESLGGCAVREILEETGLEISLGPLLCVSDFLAPPRHVVDFIFRGRITGGEFQQGSDDNLEALRFVPIGQLEAMDVRPQPAVARALERGHCSDGSIDSTYLAPPLPIPRGND